MKLRRFLPLLLLVSNAAAQDAPISKKEYAVSKAWLESPPAEGLHRVTKGDPVAPATIALPLDRGVWAGADVLPLGVGVPLKEGQVRQLDELSITTPDGTPLPAAFTKRTVWPDGSLQWVWADFQAAPQSHYTLAVRGGKQADLPAGIRVSDQADAVVVNNGALEMRWDKRFATPLEVAAVTAGGDRKPLAAGDGQGVYLVDQNGRRFVLGGEGSELAFKVESANALRAVLRLEGWYVNESGEQAARAIVRYYLDWRQPAFKVEHTFIVTRDNDEIAYREIGLTFPATVSGPAEARFGIQDGAPIVAKLGGPQDEASIFQDRYPLYHKKASHFGVHQGTSQIAEGTIAAGWTELHNGTANLLVAFKDFAPQFPAELSARADGVTAKIWSGRDGRVLDYRPSTLAKDWWGEWLDRLDYSRDQIRAKERMKASGKDTDFAYFTAEQIKALNPSCVGTARSHTLLVAWHDGSSNPARAAAMQALLDRPPVVQPDPKWICHVDTKRNSLRHIVDKLSDALDRLTAVGRVYQFKITLKDCQSPIWRRIQVKDCTLDQLHEHIQLAMGWTNSHLHDFKINGRLYGDPMLLEDNFEEMHYQDSTTTQMSDILPKNGQRFLFEYQYDFGDSWDHEVLFEGWMQAKSDLKYPVCLEGERACPPEDVGGTGGYEEFLIALADPAHEQHQDYLKWCGGKFDAERFNPVETTKSMKQGLPNWREMEDDVF